MGRNPVRAPRALNGDEDPDAILRLTQRGVLLLYLTHLSEPFPGMCEATHPSQHNPVSAVQPPLIIRRQDIL